jgi:hypothetical protein
VSDLAGFEFDEEEGKKWTEEEIRHLQEITGPHLCCMIAQKGFPGLSTGSFGPKLLHILPDSPFTDANIQLEKLKTSNAREQMSQVASTGSLLTVGQG